jgi:hypothetical protein
MRLAYSRVFLQLLNFSIYIVYPQVNHQHIVSICCIYIQYKITYIVEVDTELGREGRVSTTKGISWAYT